MKSNHDSLLSQAGRIFQPIIDELEFRAAITLHAVIELFSRLRLPDKVFIVFVQILAYTRGKTEFVEIPQRTIAHAVYDLRNTSDSAKDVASRRVGRYAAHIRDKQAFVVVQIEIRKTKGRSKNEISQYAAPAWEIIHNAIEYLPDWETLPTAYDQCKAMQEAMDRAIEDYQKGNSKLAARLGQRKLPLTRKQKITMWLKQISHEVEADFLENGPASAWELLLMQEESSQAIAGELRAWEGRKDYLAAKVG